MDREDIKYFNNLYAYTKRTYYGISKEPKIIY